jgi:hypothetical protein
MLVSGPTNPAFSTLRARLNFMLSTPTARLRTVLLALGAILGLSGIWMVIPDLLSPKAPDLPFERATAEAAAKHRTGALMAAEIGLVRGDLWAKAAFAGAPFLWTDRSATLDPNELKQLERVRNTTETALALAPINGAAWLFLAKLPATSPEAESRVGPLLEMSYFTAPSAPDLALSRIQRAATSTALANKDLQTFVSGDLREGLGRGPQFQQAIIAAYRNALPQNQAVFESLITDADPALAQMLRSSPPK